jgi:hypothetical protein
MNSRDELPELDAEELALLAAFQDEQVAPTEVHARVRGRVLESTAPAPTPVVRGPWRPWAITGAVGIAAATVLAVGLRERNATPVAQQTEVHAADVVESAPSQAVTPPQASPVAAQPTPAPEAEPTAVPTSEDRPPKTRRAKPDRPSPRPAETSSSATSSLAEETRILERARKALADNDAGHALALLDEARERFPQGVLRQERAALRVVALCQTGRQQAGKRAAAAFLQTYPRSAHRARVERACTD